MNIQEKIKKIAEELGFDLVGVADVVDVVTGYEQLAISEKLYDWVKKGYHADMKWFADSVEKRKDILKVMPGAKSVICVAMNYYNNTNIRMSTNDTNNTNKENMIGKIARYAHGRDYHKIFDKKLKLFSQKLKEIFPEGEFKYYSDTGPVLERAWAQRAGLGFIGKNTNLITKYGSWVLLGEIITNADFSMDKVGIFTKSNFSNNNFIQEFPNLKPQISKQIPNFKFKNFKQFIDFWKLKNWKLFGNWKLNKVDFNKINRVNTCDGCERCIKSCPTGALCAPYMVDARKCISYLTIEYKGEIPMELREKMGNRIFGCDACQEVCPFNIGRSSFAKATADKAESELTEKMIAGKEIDLREILSIKTDEEFLRKFAGSPVMRAKRKGLIRNACIVAGNSGDGSLLPYLEKCLKDKELIIVETARWAIGKLELGV